jgi:hypothetical protein
MRLLLALSLAVAAVGPAPSLRQAHSEQLPNTISGRVLDPAGRPVPGTVVTLMERGERHGRLEYHFVDARLQEITDANGAYRIINARLGDYVVVAIPRNPTTKNGAMNRFGFGITYYPDAANPIDAKLVTVRTTTPVTADVRLRPAVLPVVSGTVFASNGAPVKEGVLHIAHGDHLFGIDSRQMPIRPDGSFVLAALPPGRYFLQYRESAWPPSRGEIPVVSQASVVMRDSDIAGVNVSPIHMVKATGRVIVDAAQRSNFVGSKYSISGEPENWDGNPGPTHPGTVRDDLTFEFASWPGPHYVRVLIYEPGWSVKTIHLNGVDITDKPIDFKDGEPVSGIEIEVAGPRRD